MGMVDIHTHILPGVDDGSKNVDMSLAMLRMELEQGVDVVTLTPHFYRDKEEPAHFLKRRAAAYEKLTEELEGRKASAPKLLLGAEVAWVPNMLQWPELDRLCINNSNYMLLEMPFYTWNAGMLREIYELMEQGITPIFAHLERYVKHQKKEYIREIIGMGMPVQVSSAPMPHFFERRDIVKFLKRHQAHIMASDCHNITTRPPNLGMGMQMVGKLLGEDAVDRLNRHADQLIEHIIEDKK